MTHTSMPWSSHFSMDSRMRVTFLGSLLPPAHAYVGIQAPNFNFAIANILLGSEGRLASRPHTTRNDELSGVPPSPRPSPSVREREQCIPRPRRGRGQGEEA